MDRIKNAVYLQAEKQNGAIAQVVEQRTENPCVPGSNPGGTTKTGNKKVTRFFFLHTVKKKTPKSLLSGFGVFFC